MNPKNKTRPHAELIHAWADGKTIQIRLKESQEKWKDLPGSGLPLFNDKHFEYRIRPEEPSNEPWKPKEGEQYFFVRIHVVYKDLIEISHSFWENDALDKKLYDIGNCFRTAEEAKAAIPRVEKALKNLYSISDKKAHDLECELYDKIDRLTKYPEIDGKPLTDGEKALIKALRRSDRITNVYDYRTTVLVSANDNASGVYTHRQHIAFFTNSSDEDDELIIRALKQIKAEQEASND